MLCEISFVHDVPLNETHPHLRVNFLQYIEWGPDGKVLKQFSWVTDLVIAADNASHLARGGRSRWKVENESFNTLKKQGYHFEHNYLRCPIRAEPQQTLATFIDLVNQRLISVPPFPLHFVDAKRFHPIEVAMR